MNIHTEYFTKEYPSPLGTLRMYSDGTALTGLWFTDPKEAAEDGEAKAASGAEKEKTMDIPALADTERWLDVYFQGKDPGELPCIRLSGTPFQMMVWELLRQIPYGHTVTYGELAAEVARKRKLPRMSAQAVGQAVSKNPVGILIPCHRVIGKDSSLTGYAGGLPVKEVLLKLEGFSIRQGFVEKR